MKSSGPQKRIALIGYNFAPEPTGIGKYSGEMMHWLAERGHHCTVVSTYPYYPFWRVQEPYRRSRFFYKTQRKKFESGGELIVIRCPIYVPKNPSGLKRILLDVSFLVSSFFPIARLLFVKRMDLVVSVAPSFMVGVPALFYKLFRRTRLVYHIQDMQIEAARDLKMVKSDGLIKVLFSLENWMLKRVDEVSTISAKMQEKIGAKTGKPVYFFPNWVDTDIFYPIADRAAIKSQFGFQPSDIVALYSGGIGQKQGLEAILEAAAFFAGKPNLKFVICGSGPYKATLEALVEEKKLANVYFFPLQPFEKFNAFLNMADVHLVIQKGDASDLMMPSKLTSILSVGGLALITANRGSGLHDLVENFQLAMAVDAENQDQLNEAMNQFFNNDIQADLLKGNARKYAESYLNIHNVMARFEQDQLYAYAAGD
jgi:colanic acid biosynthesis glycosyl transferase WcaI